MSDKKTAYPSLDEMIKEAWPKSFISKLAAKLNKQNIGLRSIDDPVYTTTQGRLVFNILLVVVTEA